MADKTPGIHAHHGAVGVGENNGSITVNNQFLMQSGLTEQEIQKREAQYLRRVAADCGGLEWLTLMNLEEGGRQPVAGCGLYRIAYRIPPGAGTGTSRNRQI